jgi:hypothetical protein
LLLPRAREGDVHQQYRDRISQESPSTPRCNTRPRKPSATTLQESVFHPKLGLFPGDLYILAPRPDSIASPNPILQFFARCPSPAQVIAGHDWFLCSLIMLRSDPVSDPWLSAKIASRILLYIHFAYPVVLLVFFLVAFTANSIITASPVAELSNSNGPGGKPLPASRTAVGLGGPRKSQVEVSPLRKTLFSWLSVAVIVSFIGNAINVIVHSLTERGWWCGESVAVSTTSPLPLSLSSPQRTELFSRIAPN